MSFLGNTPTTQSFTSLTERFNGNGSATTVTLSRAVWNVSDIEVLVNNVQQDPYDAYTVNGTQTLTFTEAPSSGTGNIIVTYRNYTISRFIPAEGTVIGSSIQTGAITGDKIAVGTLTGNLFVDGTITGQDIAVSTITGNLIANATITGDKIGLNAITGNLIAATTITGDKIGLTAITGNLIAATTITSDKIATTFNINGTVGATTPASASVTTLTTSSTITHNGGTANGVPYLNGSKVLTTGSTLVFDGTNLGVGLTPVANNGILQLGSYSSVQTLIEKANISATAATANVNFDAATQAVLYYTSNASANWTLNVRANNTTALNTIMQTGQSLTVAFLVTQGATPYYNTVLQVDGSAVTPKWQSNSAPTAGNASSIDVYTYTIIKTGSAAFTVLASQVQFK